MRSTLLYRKMQGPVSLRLPTPTDPPLEGEPMTRDYEIQRQREAYAAFVQGMMDDGSWDVPGDMMLPGPDGPLNKADLEQIWREHTFGLATRQQPAGGIVGNGGSGKGIDLKTCDIKTVNLSLDLYQIECHAQEYMRKLGITYEHATPQSIADCWWFWGCRNVPDPLPAALKILKVAPRDAIGYGLSKEDAKRLQAAGCT